MQEGKFVGGVLFDEIECIRECAFIDAIAFIGDPSEICAIRIYVRHDVPFFDGIVEPKKLAAFRLGQPGDPPGDGTRIKYIKFLFRMLIR